MVKQTKTIAITGATGFVGINLQQKLKQEGWGIIPLGRADFQEGERSLAKKMEGAQVIINLAGAPIIGRWTPQYKKILYESRITLTNKLVAALRLLEKKPEAFISTSAVGIYTNEGTHTEEKYSVADNYLGKLASDWEKAALESEKYGVRTVIFRLGVVLGKGGGALGKMLVPFKLGLGGTIGSGEQYFSWIHIDDLIKGYVKAVHESSYRGIYNLTSPESTTNRGLTKELGVVLSRPTIIPVPKFILTLLMGEGAQVLTSGQKAYPKRLLDAGFSFRFRSIHEALKDIVD